MVQAEAGTVSTNGNGEQTVIITGNEAAALGVKLCGVQVVAAYPITPQSQVTETLSRYVENGEMEAEYVTVESEHSALAVCIAASTVGARVFTATSANGLAYMCEQIHWAAGARLPLVMACVNRAMAAPWNVLNDQQDSMSQRDAGWIQIYARDNQEILDSIIQAYRIAEATSVPVMLCYDGYVLSHTVMPVEVPCAEAVARFLPGYTPHTILDPANPKNLNQVTLADPRVGPDGDLCHGYMELRYLLQEALENAFETIIEVDDAFGEAFGRRCGGLTWEYQLDDAEVILMAAGSLATEATVAVDELRAEGCRAGVLGLRVYRPFPAQVLVEKTRGAQLVAVFDKSLSYGKEGPICSDLKSALYHSDANPPVHGYVAGLGGRDVKARELAAAVRGSLGWSEEAAPHTAWVNCQI
jgi:pyruvate/2-oxoacid:ferredoxin oxidoreductase alpha subunit